MSLLLLFGGGSGEPEPQDQPFDIVIAEPGFSGFIFIVPNIVVPNFDIKQSFSLLFEEAKDFSVDFNSKSNFVLDFYDAALFSIAVENRPSLRIEFDAKDSSFSIESLCKSKSSLVFIGDVSVESHSIGETSILRYIKEDV